MGSVELPSEPEQPGRIERLGAGGTERSMPKAREAPDPDERGRVYVETGEAISRVREVEPRISADMGAIERENTYGGWLEGFEFRLKGEGRLKERITEKLRVQPDREVAEIIREIPDATRYTFCVRPEIYRAGYHDIKQRPEERGYEMYYSRNWWTNPEYKGINTGIPDGAPNIPDYEKKGF